MMREKYESLSAAALKDIAKARGLRNISTLKKSQLVERMLEEDAKEEAARGEAEKAAKAEPAEKIEETGKGENPEPETKPERNSRAAEGESMQERRPRREPGPRTEGMRRRNIRTESGEAFKNEGQSRPYQNQNHSRYQNPNRWNENRTAESQIAGQPQYQNRWNDSRSTENQSQSQYQNQWNENRAPQSQESEQQIQPQNQPQPQYQNRWNENRETAAAPRNDAELHTEDSAEAENHCAEDRPNADLTQLDSGITVEGILEVLQDGYGFIRSNGYMPGENDVYVSPSQIRRFNLRTGDLISGNTRIKTQQEKFSALLYLKSVNGIAPGIASRRTNFEDMTPIFPNQRLKMECDSKNTAMRIVDMISPIGKGQRGMIVSPPKAGKTTLLKEMAKSILHNNPEIYLMILLIDERPEEVTDIRESIVGENVEVVYSTFDETPEHHKRVSEMVIERARRLVEHKNDVVILLDSITRLARAYNLTVQPSGRTLSGGLDPAALHMPKRFFGAARNMREGGSLTVLATALVDTGSKMDDVVYEEFKGTGNMELVLDRKLSERRVFPAIDIPKSGTRRDDLLLDKEEQEAAYIMRKALNGMKPEEAVENIINMFVHTKDNKEFVQMVRRQHYI